MSAGTVTDAGVIVMTSFISPYREDRDAEIARFLDWVRNKPPDFHAPTRRSRGKNGPRRGRRA